MPFLQSLLRCLYQIVCYANILFLAVLQVFKQGTSPEAMDLVARLLEYTPAARISPLQACAHKFFDELRDPNTKLPNGSPLPPLFNFSEQGMDLDMPPQVLVEP